MNTYMYGYRINFSAFSEVVLPDGVVIRRVEQPGGMVHHIVLDREFQSSDEYFAALDAKGVSFENREIDGDELADWLDSSM